MTAVGWSTEEVKTLRTRLFGRWRKFRNVKSYFNIFNIKVFIKKVYLIFYPKELIHKIRLSMPTKTNYMSTWHLHQTVFLITCYNGAIINHLSKWSKISSKSINYVLWIKGMLRKLPCSNPHFYMLNNSHLRITLMSMRIVLAICR